MKQTRSLFLSFVLLLSLLLSSCGEIAAPSTPTSFSLEEIPPFSDQPYVILNDNQPNFPPEDLTAVSFEDYSPLDSLGRCTVAYANISLDTMPTEPRGSISQVKPTGWQSVKYDHVDGKHLYNRCHLIGFQLTAENANKENLITGTRYLNVEGMLPFENLVADYVKETGNHVLYRVTPIFEGNELVARGVVMEAYSVEDQGEGVSFHVYCYNNQPGVVIDYATGESRLEGASSPQAQPQPISQTYILNTSSKKFHQPDCSAIASISSTNQQSYQGTREALLQQGYTSCGICKP